MESPKRRISKLESTVRGNAIETFEQLMDEARREQEAAARGIPFTPRRFSDEIVRVFKEILADSSLDSETAEALRGALQDRGHL